MCDKYWPLLIIVLGLTTSCKKQTNAQNSDEVIWRLGWRVIENSMNENLAIAELQFDSLLSLNKDVETNFLIKGLEIKSKLGKEKDVIKILDVQSKEKLNQICLNQFTANLPPCKNIPEAAVENEALQKELIIMYIKDQASRGNMMEEMISKYNIDESLLADEAGVDIDEKNRNRLKEIINEFGFPNQKLVGKDAIDGIFYIIQHADGDKEWQKSQLKNIEESVRVGDMDGQSYGYLYDRIKINSGEKQLYGTQFSKVDPENKIVELFDTKDMDNLDQRRMEIGMMPIEMYKRIMLKFSGN